MKKALIVVAAGSGERLGAGIDKPYIEIEGKPLVWHTLKSLDVDTLFDQRLVVIARGTHERFRTEILDRHPLANAVELVEGGASRQESVWNGLLAVRTGVELVAIHDGARPCIDEATVRASLAACEGVDGAIVAIPVHDALKRAGGGLLVADVDRTELWRAQTPQTFHLQAIRAAHEAARRDGVEAADDASLVMRRGGSVRIVQGSKTNLKVTEPGDVRLAAMVLRDRQTSPFGA